MTDALSVGVPVSRFASVGTRDTRRLHKLIFVGLSAVLVVAPFVIYPVFVMKVMCYALFALAFNLLLGYGGLLSFGHAAFFGMASYVSAYCAASLGFNPEFAILNLSVRVRMFVTKNTAAGLFFAEREAATTRS